MTIGEARQLLTYDAWANARLFSAAEGLTEAELEAPAASSFPSIRATLAHVVMGEWVWLRRWRGESPPAEPAWASEATLAGLRAQLVSVEADRDRFLSGLCDADLEGVVSYRNLKGEANAETLSGLVRHVVNHSTYHRGQVATQLRQLGRTPPGTDFVAYLRQARG